MVAALRPAATARPGRPSRTPAGSPRRAACGPPRRAAVTARGGHVVGSSSGLPGEPGPRRNVACLLSARDAEADPAGSHANRPAGRSGWPRDIRERIERLVRGPRRRGAATPPGRHFLTAASELRNRKPPPSAAPAGTKSAALVMCRAEAMRRSRQMARARIELATPRFSVVCSTN